MPRKFPFSGGIKYVSMTDEEDIMQVKCTYRFGKEIFIAFKSFSEIVKAARTSSVSFANCL